MGDGMGGTGPAPAEDGRAEIRREYEAGRSTVADIVLRRGISFATLYRWRRDEGWTCRRPLRQRAAPTADGRSLSSLLEQLIEQEIEALKVRPKARGPFDDRRLKRIHAMAQVLSKTLEIQSKERELEPSAAKTLGIVDDARREEIAQCLERIYLRRRHPGQPRPAGEGASGGVA